MEEDGSGAVDTMQAHEFRVYLAVYDSDSRLRAHQQTATVRCPGDRDRWRQDDGANRDRGDMIVGHKNGVAHGMNPALPFNPCYDPQNAVAYCNEKGPWQMGNSPMSPHCEECEKVMAQQMEVLQRDILVLTHSGIEAI